MITNADPHQCTFEINKKIQEPAENFTIHIAISPTKNADRIEWFVEKAVELGVDEITLMECDHTERQHIKNDRLEKMAISAMKQSLKATLPTIHPLTSFRNLTSAIPRPQKNILPMLTCKIQTILKIWLAQDPSYLVLHWS